MLVLPSSVPHTAAQAWNVCPVHSESGMRLSAGSPDCSLTCRCQLQGDTGQCDWAWTELQSTEAEILVMCKPILFTNICLYWPALSLWPDVILPCKEWVCPGVAQPTLLPELCPRELLWSEITPYLHGPLRCNKGSMCQKDGVSLPLVMRNLSGISSLASLRLCELLGFPALTTGQQLFPLGQAPLSSWSSGSPLGCAR